MPNRTKLEVLAAIRRDGLLPIFYDGQSEIVRKVAGSVYNGGLRTFEFTNRGVGAISVFSDLASWAASELPELMVGVGSVVSEATADSYIEAGASFVVGPSFNDGVSRACNRRGITYIAGCATLTEIQIAYEHGAVYVKLFPMVTVGGPAFLAAIRAPCPWIEAIPTGGVEPTADSLRGWYDAGAPAVGMGSRLLSRDLIARGDWKGMERIVADAVATAEAVRV